MQRSVRRFYERVAIVPAEGSFCVTLGGRWLRTPAGTVLTLPTAALAAAIANEWATQGETVRPETMPLTRLAATAVERLPSRREAVADAVFGYAATDLVCYRASAPADLVQAQESAWQPLLDWTAARWGVRLRVGSGVIPIEQPAASIEALRVPVDACTDYELVALSCAVQASGSLLIGLALLDDWIDVEAASAAAMLEEIYQAERWGIDAEAERRRRQLSDEIRAAAAFLDLVRPPDEYRPPIAASAA